MRTPSLQRWCFGSLLVAAACAVEDDEPRDDAELELDDDDPIAAPSDELIDPIDPAANTCPPVPGSTCHPFYQYECPAGEGCYFKYDASGWGFDCLPDISGAGGGDGQPCDYQASCDPGLICAQAPWVPGGCVSNTGACCVHIEPLGGECPLTPDPLPFYSTVLPGPAPSECYGRIGVCMSPPPPPPPRR